MKPEPMTDEQIKYIAYSTRYQGLLETVRAVEAAVNAKWEAMLAVPHEAKTEAEKTAFAHGWWKALESVRTEYDAKLSGQPAQQEPCAVFLGWNDDGSAKLDAACEGPETLDGENVCLYLAAGTAPQKEMWLCEALAKQSVEIDQLRSTIETYKEVKEHLDSMTGAAQKEQP